jgi:hypothetical protein
MSSLNEDFGQLKQLLALKKYEQPPPGYFRNFSSQIVNRIQEGGGQDDLSEYSSWWQWLMGQYNAKPALAWVYGVTVSALLMGGFSLSRIFEAESSPAAMHPWLASSPPSSQQSLFGTREMSEPYFREYFAPGLFDHPGSSFAPAFHSAPQDHLFNRSPWLQPASLAR